jgi:hypothetical protein
MTPSPALRILEKQEGNMRRMQIWLVIVGITGIVSSALAAGLLWLLLTHPVAVATFVGRGL